MRQPLLPWFVGFLGVALACNAGDNGEEPVPPVEVPAVPPPAETAKDAADAPPVASAQDTPPDEGAGAPAGEVPCNVGAIVNDPDPSGLNVRASPEGEVLGQVPMNTQVHLAAARDGWVRIDHAWNAEDDARTWPLGWVHPSLLRTDLKHPSDYGPDRAAKLSSGPDSAGTPIRVDPMPTVEVKACQGRWLQVDLEWPDGEKRTGWLASESHCPSTVTTCP
ncbi:MAG: SH3 domain-containing protein [Deltaproteobacteria bacterium]|nr:SH3 domain-containing protein [Deltaproteobacteria bacterium]